MICVMSKSCCYDKIDKVDLAISRTENDKEYERPNVPSGGLNEADAVF